MEIKEILNKKHLLISGKSEKDRRKYINELIENTNFETFRFPKNMKVFDEYCNYIVKNKLYTPWYEAKSYNMNAILEFHYEWISENNSLVIMEELDLMEERWKIELLRIYLNEIDKRKKGDKKIHLIISQEGENGLIEKLAKVIDVQEKEKRTRSQIVKQNLELIDISLC